MNHEELIEKYFAQRLNINEKKVFEELMQTDELFREQVVYEKEVQKAITLNEREELKKKLQSIEKKKPKRNYSIWVAAASFSILFGIGYWTISNQIDTNAVYEE
jgi:hypothetical protein